MTLINPEAILQEVRAEKARRSLSEFVRQAWPLVDPGMPLRWGWHVDAICEHLEAVSRGWIRKLLINIPPGHAKSLLVAVFWPAWEWTWKPTTQSIFSSYAQELAERDSIRCRDLICQEWYQNSFVTRRWEVGPQVFEVDATVRKHEVWDFNPAQNRVNSFKNTLSGARQCLSVGSKATGFRGNKVVCDDPLNVKDATSKVIRDDAWYWWSKVMPTRINDPARDSFVMIMQRVHEEDPSGMILEGGGYEHLCLPTEFEGERRCVTYVRKPDGFTLEAPRSFSPEMLKRIEAAEPGARVPFFADPREVEGDLLFPALFTPEVVEELKKPLSGLGEDGFAGQHQQRPAPAEGAMFKYKWWRFWRPDGTAPAGSAPRPKRCVPVETHPAKPLPKIQQVVGSLDAAFKDTDGSDFVVFTVWGVYFAERYLLDLVRGRMDFSKTRSTLAGCGNKRCPGCGPCASCLLRRWAKCRRWLIEDKANGTAVVNSLLTFVPGIIPVTPEGGKESRASAMQPYVEAGQVFLPEGAEWVQTYVDEFAAFPRGKHDDQVDSSSQAIIYLSTNVDVARSLALATSL